MTSQRLFSSFYSIAGLFMRTFDKTIVAVFVIFALLAAVLGVGTLIRAYTTTRPALARIEARALETLRLAERAVEVLDAHPDHLDRLDAPVDSVVDTASNVHLVVEQTADVSLEAADALDATAQSLESIPEASALFLPEDQLASSASSLTQTAEALRQLGPRLETLSKSTRQLTDATTTAVQAADALEDEWVDARVTLAHLVEILQETRQALEGANLPTAIANRVALQAGVYLLLSVLLLGMAGIWKRLSPTE